MIAEGGVAVVYDDACVFQGLADSFVVILPAAPGSIEHHPDLHPSLVGGDDGLEQIRVGEDKHLDLERLLGRVNRVEERLR